MITAEMLRELLDYDPDTGVLRWRSNARRDLVGTEAGWIDNCGGVPYRRVMIAGKAYMAHRLAFMHVHGCWPSYRIDHIDCNPFNNAIGNLRECTASQNAANRTIDHRNKSGFKGVSFYKKTRRWVAHIRHNYRLISLGYFATPEEAAAAYRKAADELFGEFSRTD